MKIFISYATTDSSFFRIKELASKLEQLPGIDEVWYWERNSIKFSSIVKYMEYCVPKSDIILAISTRNSLTSQAVENELDLAIYKNKRIVPIFADINEVQDLLKPKPWIRYDAQNDNFDQFINKIYGILGMTPTHGLQTDSFGDQNKVELIKYNGVSLIKQEYLFLKDLEKELAGVVIPDVSEIKWDTFGFKAEKNHIVGLGLYYKNIWFLPESIGRLTNLKELNLLGYRLSSLPESIGHLTNLQTLSINDNQLSSLPEIITQMTWLKVLDIGVNQISSLPESIGALKNLTYLNLESNELSLPRV
ncbi:MAG: leucine-rich repeat domain-containing protein [Promethearchaeota archaeon]